MIDNIFKHNSRSYYDVYLALTQAYPNKPTWLFKEMAGLFDFQSELMNRIATDLLYPVTREAAYAFASRCDYTPTEADGATDTITFTLTAAMTKTLAAGYQVGGISPSTGEMCIFELTASASSGGTATITATAKQKQTYTGIYLGIIDSQDDFMDYPIDGYKNIIKSTASLTINSQTWTRVDNFDASTSSSRHFCLLYQSSGKVRYQFGDGVNGQKPALNSVVYGTFAVTKGSVGKLNAGEITTNIGQDSDIASLTNTGCSNGNDAESVASIIRNSRANARLRNAVWSKEDIETAARASSASVQKAYGIPNIASASVQIIPSGGGNPTALLKTAVAAYIKALTPFGQLTVYALDPSYITQNITAGITVRDGYVEATVVNLTKFGMTMCVAANDNEIIDYYLDYGIDLCRTNKINTIWSWAFTSAENDALEFIIKKWITLLGTRNYRDWGQSFEVGNAWIMGDGLYDYGVDEFNISYPLVNTTVTSTQIIGEGTITVTAS